MQVLLSSVPKHVKIYEKDLIESENPQMALVKCTICSGILFQPLVIQKCQHVFYFPCIMPHIEGKPLKDLFCPTCDQNFLDADLISSKISNEILNTLQYSCKNGCGRKYKINETKIIQDHEENCNGKDYTLVDILNLPMGAPLPKHAEKAAAHIIKSKMVGSSLPNRGVALNTGSSRVSICVEVIIVPI